MVDPLSREVIFGEIFLDLKRASDNGWDTFTSVFQQWKTRLVHCSRMLWVRRGYVVATWIYVQREQTCVYLPLCMATKRQPHLVLSF